MMVVRRIKTPIVRHAKDNPNATTFSVLKTSTLPYTQILRLPLPYFTIICSKFSLTSCFKQVPYQVRPLLPV